MLTASFLMGLSSIAVWSFGRDLLDAQLIESSNASVVFSAWAGLAVLGAALHPSHRQKHDRS